MFFQPGIPRQRKSAGAVKGTPKKGKKRNPWSDDDEKSDSDLDDSEQPVIPRDMTSRRASGVCSSPPHLRFYTAPISRFKLKA